MKAVVTVNDDSDVESGSNENEDDSDESSNESNNADNSNNESISLYTDEIKACIERMHTDDNKNDLSITIHQLKSVINTTSYLLKYQKDNVHIHNTRWQYQITQS